MALKLMLVDRYHALEENLRSILDPEGIEVVSFTDGLTALDMLSKVDPDLVVADYKMEGMNILRFCEKFQRRSVTKKRPILLMTDNAEPFDQSRLSELGVSCFLNKPLNIQILVQKIKEHLPSKTTATTSPVDNSNKQENISKEQMDNLKIEELLGWSNPKGESGQAPPPVMEDDERTLFEPRPVAQAVTPSVESTPQSPKEAADLSTPSALPIEAADYLSDALSSQPTEVISPAPAPEGKPVDLSPVQEKSSFSTPEPENVSLPPEMDNTASSQLAREVIEKVAWEVVPAIAEALIKEEIEKLKSGQSK